ncbi:MAG: hypothetical protein JRJ65_03080 [Deltaproteobacteria bacterium]|nr:hypothetical protein [Deltaproteobacteria bacterium]
MIDHHLISLGCPVDARTLLHNLPFGSICLRLDTAIGIGTCVYWPFQLPTTMFVRPAIPACTALCPRSRQNTESCGFAGMLLIM